MGYLKEKSSLRISDKYGNRHFQPEGYYVSVAGLNEAIIKKYIQEQEKHDIVMDKLSTREYEHLDISEGQHLYAADIRNF